MPIYQTEDGDIDFLSELEKIDITQSNNTCLISGDELLDTHITLNCGHSFNYLPIYNEIIQNKIKNNKLHLDVDQIQCPYCRQIQDELIPYNSLVKCSKKIGVNWYNPKEFVNEHPNVKIKQNQQCGYWSCNKTNHVFVDPKDKVRLCYRHYQKHCDNQNTNHIIQLINNDTEGTTHNNNDHVTLTRCKALIQSGANKGKQCVSMSTKDNQYGFCKRHSKILSNLIVEIT